MLSADAWGAAQAATVEAAGGTVTFSHEGTGLAIAKSSNPSFLLRVLSSGAIGRGAEDMTVEWVKPTAAPAELVTQGDETFANFMWNTTAVEAQGAWEAEGRIQLAVGPPLKRDPCTLVSAGCQAWRSAFDRASKAL